MRYPIHLAATAVLLTASASAQHNAAGTLRKAGPVRNAGIYHVATGTWTRNVSSMANLGPDVIYANTAPSGYFTTLDLQNSTGDVQLIDEGRIPGLGGNIPTADRSIYEVNGLAVSYCTEVPTPTIEANFTLYESYLPCDLPSNGAPTTQVSGTAGATGLPGGGAPGAFTCWTVTLDLEGVGEFSLQADGGSASPGFDNDTDLDSFGISWEFTGQFGQATGPMLAGNPDWTEADSGSITGVGGSGTYYYTGASSCADTGLDTSDIVAVDGAGTSLPAGPGCYFFGGYKNTNGCMAASNNSYSSFDTTVFGGGIQPQTSFGLNPCVLACLTCELFCAAGAERACGIWQTCVNQAGHGPATTAATAQLAASPWLQSIAACSSTPQTDQACTELNTPASAPGKSWELTYDAANNCLAITNTGSSSDTALVILFDGNGGVLTSLSPQESVVAVPSGSTVSMVLSVTPATTTFEFAVFSADGPGLNGDGFAFLSIGGSTTGSTFCEPAGVNSSGNTASISATISGSLGGTQSGIRLDATGGPDVFGSAFGFFLVSDGNTINVPLGDGNLCLNGPQGRYNPAAGGLRNSLGRFNASGDFESLSGNSATGFGFDVPTQLPSPPGGNIAVGSTWHFQLWYRDTSPTGPTVNLTNGTSVTF